MTTSVVCKTEYVTPPPGQYLGVSQSGYDRGPEVPSELNLVEMTEMEYTHLQHLIHSDAEPKVNAPTCRACPSPRGPVTLTPLYPEARCSERGSNEATESSQEINMVLYNHPARSPSPNRAETTPTRRLQGPSSVLAKVKCAVEVPRDRGDLQRIPRGSRPNPTARVCLEKRFNRVPSDVTRQQETQAAVLNIFLSLLHQTTDVSGIALHAPPDRWPKTEQGVTAGHTYEGSPISPPGPGTSQGLGHSARLTENKTVIAPRSFSHGSDQSSGFKSPSILYTDPVHQLPHVNNENEAVRKPRKRIRMHSGRALQVKDLNTLHQGSDNTKAASKASRRAGRPPEGAERRERHNSKERERRRRIRLCCDELNLLVPFCNPETDKASTLRWTTAFLKYIQEVYGDSIKQEFQSTFCGKTGVRLKPSYSEVATGDPSPNC